MKPWIFGALLTVFALGGCASHSSAPENADSGAKPADAQAQVEAAPVAVAVSVGAATLRPMETLVSAQGLLSPATGAFSRVAPQNAGRLSRVLVGVGNRVSAGQLLALMDNRSNAATSRSAQAALSASISDARQAQIAARAQQGEAQNALAQAQIGLENALAQRRGAILAAQNALEAAQSDARKTRLSSGTGTAQNAVEAARLGVQSARLDAQTAVKAAQNALESAQTDLDKLRAGPRAPEIAAARAGVESARATRDRAQTEVERAQFLFERGIRAKRELDDAQTALAVAQNGLQSAQDALDLLLAGARPQELRAGQLAVQSASETLSAAQKSGAARIKAAQNSLQAAQIAASQTARTRPEETRGALLRVSAARDALILAQQSGDASLAAARAALRAAQAGTLQIAAKNEDARSKNFAARGKAAELQGAEIAASSGEIRTPIAGIITKRTLNSGDMADPATPFLEISDASALQLSAQLPAERGAGLRAGQSARITSESAPGATFSGRVQSVGDIDPQSGLQTVNVVVFNPRGALKIGALANCAIVLRHFLAVAIPRAALLSRDGGVAVMAAQKQVAHEKKIQTGVENGAWIEVRGGLKAGETVITRGQYELEDGAAIKIAP